MRQLPYGGIAPAGIEPIAASRPWRAGTTSAIAEPLAAFGLGDIASAGALPIAAAALWGRRTTPAEAQALAAELPVGGHSPVQHLPLGGTAALHAPLQLELSPLRHLPLGQLGAPLQPELSPLRQWPAEGTAPVGAQPIAAPALGGQHSNRSPAHCGTCPLEAPLQPELGPLRLLSSSGIAPVGAQLPGGSCPRGALLRPERSANAPVALGWLCSSGVRPVRQVLADGFDPTGAQPIAATALGGTATSGGPPLGFVTACDASRDHYS